MNVAIVEDDNATALQIREFVMQFGKDNGEQFDVSIFGDGLDFLDGYKAQYSIILLDIELPHSNGMEVVRKIRETDMLSVIMFITNLSSYAVQGYSVDAVDYVLKPLNYQSFVFRFRRAMASVMRADKRKIQIRSERNLLKIDIDDIYYLEICGHELKIHTLRETIEAWSSLSAVEKQLPSWQFARCDNCYLVNLKYVRAINKDTVVVGNSALKISRNRRKAFLAALTDYV